MNSNSFQEEIERGEQLFQYGETEEALAIFESVLAKDPDNAFALNDKGVVLNKSGRYQEAIQVFSEILDKDNNNPNAVFNLTSNYLSIGNWQEAENILMIYGHVLSQQDVEMMRKDIGKVKPDRDKPLHAGRAKEASLFDYGKAQEAINNALHKNLFFIMGVPKSGTTWLQYLLNEHPEIICSGEGDFNRLINGFEGLANDYNMNIASANKNIGTTNYLLFTRENLQYLFVSAVGMLLSNLHVDPGVRCIGSKNPILTKTLQVHASLLPNAKFIHVIREGRDVIVSAWFNNLRANEDDTRRRWPDFRSFVEFGVKQWVSDIQVARSFGRAEPGRYSELRYEELHATPDLVIQQVLEFLGVDASSAIVRRCRQAGEFEKLSRGRSRGQEDRNAFFRKGIIGDWRNHFDQQCLDIFMRYGGDLLRTLGYEQN